nr:hypothetical protein [Tanacetum cinerariifolium]GFC12989.1 hypothetical protein [Tanacetum cinerariifolium]
MEEIDLSFNPDDPMPSSIKDDDNDSDGDTLSLERLLHDDPIPLSDTLDLSSIPGNLKILAKRFYPPSLNFLSFN